MLRVFLLLLLLVNSSHCSKLRERRKRVDSATSSSSSSDEEAQVAISTQSLEITAQTVPRQHDFQSNTLMIDQNFRNSWTGLLSHISARLPVYQEVQSRAFCFLCQSRQPLLSEIDSYALLIAGIKENDREQVSNAILNGAKFLSLDPSRPIRTSNHIPIEMAVLEGKIDALASMLLFLPELNPKVKKTFLAGLLILAVQAGKVGVVKFLVNSHDAPYLSGSFLFQKAITHHAPLELLTFLIDKFSESPELECKFGRYGDNLRHLAVRFNNHEAFAFLFLHTRTSKIEKNSQSHSPINLVFVKERFVFVDNLLSISPEIGAAWTDRHGNNLLHLAVYADNLEFVQKLVEFYILPLNGLNYKEETPLMFSVKHNRRPITLYLLQVGADPWRMNPSKGVDPVLSFVRENDVEAFKLAINQSDTVGTFKLQAFTQYLIGSNYWKFVDIMLGKFRFLHTLKFTIRPIAAENSFLYSMPHLLQYLLKFGHLDATSVILHAIHLDNLEIIKTLQDSNVISVPEHHEALEKTISLEKNSFLRYFLSLNGWNIPDTFSQASFYAIITNGASFSSNSLSCVTFESLVEILLKFANYFMEKRSGVSFNVKEIVIVCLQVEIFLFHHVIVAASVDPTMIAALRTLQIYKILLSNRISSLVNPIIYQLIRVFGRRNAEFLQIHFLHDEFHELQAHNLIGCVQPENFYLITEYQDTIYMK
jgi:hypothetical protein